jgi:energy-coupling factor transport system permease protein
LAKLAAILILMIGIGMADSVSAELILLAILVSVVLLTDPLRFISALKPFSFLFAFTFLIQLFVTADGHLTLPGVSAILSSAYFTLRIFLLIGFSLLFALTVSETDILRVLRYIFSPLKFIKISPDELAISSLIALRFIPILFNEAEKIKDSRHIMALGQEKRGKIETLKATFSLMIPLFIRAFYYAAQIAVTLRYRRGSSHFFKLPPMTVKDYLFSASALAVSVTVALI